MGRLRSAQRQREVQVMRFCFNKLGACGEWLGGRGGGGEGEEGRGGKGEGEGLANNFMSSGARCVAVCCALTLVCFAFLCHCVLHVWP